MRASELRPGQFFEPKPERLKFIQASGPLLVCENEAGERLSVSHDMKVTPLNVHGWDDEPQSEPLADKFIEAAVKAQQKLETTEIERLKRFWQGYRNAMKEAARTVLGGSDFYVNSKFYELTTKPEPVKPAPLQLREGARFLMRQQGETGPLHKVEQEDYVWSDGTHSWTAEGRYWASGWDSPYDLVAEVEEKIAQHDLAEKLTEFVAEHKEELLDALNKPQPDADGWIEHDGKGCPVARSQRVMIRVYGFSEDSYGPYLASDVDWEDLDRPTLKITHYRLVQPAPITHWVEVVTR